MSKSRFHLFAVLAVCLCAAVGVSAASAGHHHHHGNSLKYVSKSLPLPDGFGGAAGIAKCPKGTSVTGGGTFASGPNDGSVVLSSSSPEPAGGAPDPKKGWIGYANNQSGAAQTLDIYAICSKQKSKLEYVSKTLTLGQGAQGASGIAKCPKGTSVIGGGVFVSGPNNGDIEVTSSSPEPAGGSADPTKGWIAYAYNKSGADQTLSIYAICSSQAAKLKYVSDTETLPSSNQGAAGIAKCPKGTSVAGGGAFASGPNNGDIVLSSSSPEPAGGTADPKKGWIGYATNHSGSSQTLSIYAICMKH